MDDKALPTRQEDDFFTILGNSFKLIEKSWEALLLNLGTFVQIYIIPFVLVFLSLFLITTLATTTHSDGATMVSVLLGIVATIGLLILLVLLSIASIITQLASVRGQKISFREVVDQSQPFFWRFVGLGILSILIVVIGFVLLIIPGLIATVLLVFAGYVMIDKNLGAIDSIKVCTNLVKKNWKIALALVVVQAAIQLPQVVPFLGALVTVVLSIAYFCLPAILYLRIAGTTKSPAKKSV